MAQSVRGNAHQELTVLTIFLLIFTHQKKHEQPFLLTI